jgi:hypothetical protein
LPLSRKIRHLDCSGEIFVQGSVLPRLAAAEGLFLLAWPKRNKNPRLAAFLVKNYGNLDSGSIEAFTLAYPTAPALILPWVVGL